VHVYGLTETYGPITKGYHMPEWDAIPASDKYARMARQGHGFLTSLPVRVIKPDQPDGVLVDVARNGKEIGEIIFYGNICAQGYFKDAEATRKLFLGGALHSGDLAVWHEDGSIQIQDRAKDIIISGMLPRKPSRIPIPISNPFLPLFTFSTHPTSYLGSNETFDTAGTNANVDKLATRRWREHLVGRSRKHVGAASRRP
jgi:hypothetical protein